MESRSEAIFLGRGTGSASGQGWKSHRSTPLKVNPTPEGQTWGVPQRLAPLEQILCCHLVSPQGEGTKLWFQWCILGDPSAGGTAEGTELASWRWGPFS